MEDIALPDGVQEVPAPQFSERFRGYARDEVDGFAQRVTEELSELGRERDVLRQQTAELHAELAEAREAERLLRRTLAIAERAAEDALAEARAHANRIITEAERQARAEEDRLRDMAERMADTVDSLRRFRRAYRERFHEVVEDQLEALDRLPELPELASAEDLLDRLRPEADAQDETEAVTPAGDRPHP